MYKKLENLNLFFDDDKVNFFDKYIALFVDYNEKVNLVSNNDVKVLFEKHIFTSPGK